MMWLMMLAWVVDPAWAVDDPDRTRSVPKGVEVFDPARVEAGKSYSAFVIGFPGQAARLVSPSRYAVTYLEGLLRCGNADAAGINNVQDGRWWTVVFTVHAIKETAVEQPVGSGVWTWRTEFDCTIASLSAAG